MAKEWDKFQADYKKLAPKIEKYSSAKATDMKNQLNSANTNCGEGERHLSDSMVVARKNGVTGDTLVDFMKDKSFAEAYKLLQTANNMLAEELLKMESFSKEAGVVQAEVVKLDAAITKDLKSRKDSSASKKDIEDLQDKLATDIKSLKEAAGKYDGVEKLKKNRPANFPKTVADILKEAPDVQEKRRDATMLPQLLVDRNMKANVQKAKSLFTSIQTATSDALDLAGNDDMAGATGKLKAAGLDLKELAALNASYQKLKTTNKQDIDISKDKGKIETAMTTIQKAYTAAESKVRGAVTTMKKAG